jgi:hypothetical protein
MAAAVEKVTTNNNVPGCLMVGTGEYTTGFVGGEASDSDKGAGVVGLVMFDLRQRGKVGRLAMCGTNGSKFPAIRNHLKAKIGDGASQYFCVCIFFFFFHEATLTFVPFLFINNLPFYFLLRSPCLS